MEGTWKKVIRSRRPNIDSPHGMRKAMERWAAKHQVYDEQRALAHNSKILKRVYLPSIVVEQPTVKKVVKREWVEKCDNNPTWDLVYPRFSSTSNMRKETIITASVTKLVHKLLCIGAKSGLEIQIIGRKRQRNTKISTVKQKARKFLHCETRHESGEYKRIDSNLDSFWLDKVQEVAMKYDKMDDDLFANLHKGDSGLTFMKDGKLFIVRGKHGNEIVNSLEPTSHVMEITHYNDPQANDFWRGYTDAYVANRNESSTHSQHIPTIGLEECGKRMALLEILFHSTFKITCKHCNNDDLELADEEFGEKLYKNIQRIENQQSEYLAKDQKLKRMLEFVKKRCNPKFEHLPLTWQIAETVGHFNDNQSKQIMDINEALIKVNTITTEEATKASLALLELSRWYKNRKEASKADDLSTFRNKISPKSTINAALMCDNQLDPNGNFLWGKREYHAKRFFTNYFEVVDPTDSYEKHVTRFNPNGQRKLSIGKLVIPLNFQKVRDEFTGISITRQPISKSCVSRIDNAYIYPCCCVTTEFGQPAYSEIIPPTKGHITIGNSVDPKIVDLPQTDPPSMYIAKNGYCYLNIFLAAMINVNEDSAKDYTKFLRDEMIERLGTWPKLKDVATACYMLSVMYPEIKSAEIPQILVDHEHKTMHVVDSYGSLSTGFHILKANTVGQLIRMMYDSMDSEMREYVVGGTITHKFFNSLLGMLVKNIFKPDVIRQIMIEEPFLLMMAVASPTVLIALYNNCYIEQAMAYWIVKNQSIAAIFAQLEALAKKTSQAELLVQQMTILEKASSQLRYAVMGVSHVDPAKRLLWSHLEAMNTRAAMNKELIEEGYALYDERLYAMMEKIYVDQLNQAWAELSYTGRFLAILRVYKVKKYYKPSLVLKRSVDLGATYNISATHLMSNLVQKSRTQVSSTLTKLRQGVCDKIEKMRLRTVRTVYWLIPDIFRLIHVVLVLSILTTVANTIINIVQDYKKLQKQVREEEYEREVEEVRSIHAKLMKIHDDSLTREEFLEYIREHHPRLIEATLDLTGVGVIHENKSRLETNLEQAMAFGTLLTMIFDPNKSDAVFKVLNKMKTVINTFEQNETFPRVDFTSIFNNPVVHQSADVDTPLITSTEKNLTIDFDTSHDLPADTFANDVTFDQWWSNQLENNRTVPHYRLGGKFVEFTRERAAIVSVEIAHEQIEREFLLRGAVGSGKSTGLPYHLSLRGKVLMLEPTRPLAENVCRQLQGAPFNVSPTLQMRGLSSFGSTPISIMTSGFALHLYANNPDKLNGYDFIIFDECHIPDASAMAFYCLIKEYNFNGKILKVSATPPGRELEFSTQHPVEIHKCENLTHSQFAMELGTGSLADATKYGNNILVYVASYNEVDSLARALSEKHYNVIKVDGRTMKHNVNGIQTTGTDSRKCFVVATNIIENGVTLDVDVVVDFGLKVTADLDVDNRAVIYKKTNISFGERIQRLGRVGRTKPGTVIRAGVTMKGVQEIPSMIATDAAFLCFAYGLKVITHNVSTTHLAKCTVKQARTMMQFELSPFLMVELVKYDGPMHPQIHEKLKKFKLKDSTVMLRPNALPYTNVQNWITAREYNRIGCNLELEDFVKIPYYVRDVPDRLYADIYDVIVKYQSTNCMGRLSSACAGKVAYTLRIDPHVLPRTIAILNALIAEEYAKRDHYHAISANPSSSHAFSLSGIISCISTRYMKDYTKENIEKLVRVRDQLLEFQGTGANFKQPEDLMEFGALNTVIHQSTEQLSQCLGLQGRWNMPLIQRDLLIAAGVFTGGALMLWCVFTKWTKERVIHQGKNKRTRQKLKFVKARDAKYGYAVTGSEECIGENFGTAYTKKGKQKGTKVGLGAKQHKFYHMYGVDPQDYNMIRFVDPLTGTTLDEQTITDIKLVQEHFDAIREEAINNDLIEKQHVYSNPGLRAFFIQNGSTNALRVDLTPHEPLRVVKGNNIAGFPEQEGTLRQTGTPIVVPLSQVPEANEELVLHEAKSMMMGLSDFNPISRHVCVIENDSNGIRVNVYAIGYGSYLITPAHLFKHNNGEITIRSSRGVYKIRNSVDVKLHPITGRDMVVMQLPKDFPPYPKKINFSQPCVEDRVCMVGVNFQQEYSSCVVSESSVTAPKGNSSFWKHWISTSNGQCGLPLVNVRTKDIVGIHSLASTNNTTNFFVAIPPKFTEYLNELSEMNKWEKGWHYNPNLISWSGLNLVSAAPTGLFKTSKLVEDLSDDVSEQCKVQETWLTRSIQDNLQVVAKCPGQLVTKHVVKGQCPHFSLYLSTHDAARDFFKPLMGAYDKSRLNKAAFTKDLLKYSKPTYIGEVNHELFEKTVKRVEAILRRAGIKQCVFVTDETEIFKSLNMNAAVGALYTGKKKDYFASFTDLDKEEIVKQSCERLYNGQIGVWNGSLKAEIRSIEKTLANKTRTFTAAPLETLLGGKVCVDDFNNQFYEHHLVGPWTVGITKFYGGWNRLLEALPDNWIYCDADGSQFDSSLTPYLINAVLQIRLNFMESWPIGEQMLKNLYTEIVFTPIATPDGSIIKKFKGNNSGQPSTVVDNTIMVILAFNYTLLACGVDENMIDSTCKMFANGDDLLIAIHPDFEYLLDEFQKHFSSLGLNFDFSSRTRDKSELWYMSTRGIKIDGMYVPKLEKERIVAILEWDRSKLPEHRLEAICAAMIEAWGYPDLLHEIRKFYAWLLEMQPFANLAKEGKAPYIAETALRNLYTGNGTKEDEIEKYLKQFIKDLPGYIDDYNEDVIHQSGTVDVGQQKSQSDAQDKGTEGAANKDKQSKENESGKAAQNEKEKTETSAANSQKSDGNTSQEGKKDKDVDTGTTGTIAVPKLKAMTKKMRLPKANGKAILNLDFLLTYAPQQQDISNTRATQEEFNRWYNAIKKEYEVEDSQMGVLMDGLMVWCIENGTSPNINGVWTMMDGDTQVTYPLKPVVENASPTLRQIMHHFSDAAEAYIEYRNSKERYMPRYGLQRNLTDFNLARYAFDFYEVTSKTTTRAKEAHMQMKAAAVRGSSSRMFGLDGNVGETQENTERHTAGDVSRNMHSLLGVQQGH
uniref:Genome polyprotein n=3 Tax=Iranian johnsongrass mosaic virus TaxID=204478 RepID=A0A1C8PQT1_9POTV|nr:polyprotein [Iranian johnsongrass mosaic virus]